jgi:hypothetical protein
MVSGKANERIRDGGKVPVCERDRDHNDASVRPALALELHGQPRQVAEVLRDEAPSVKCCEQELLLIASAILPGIMRADDIDAAGPAIVAITGERFSSK